MCACSHFESVLHPFKTLAFGHRAVVQVNSEFTPWLQGQEVIEGNDALNVDGRNTKGFGIRLDVFRPDETVFVLRLPEVVEQFDAVGG